MRSKRAWESEGTCTSSIFSSEPKRSLSPCRNLYKHVPRLTRLGRAMFADTVESELVRGNFESVVGGFYGFNFTFLFDEDIVYEVALFTDEMLIPFTERVESLQASEYEH